MCVLKYAYLTNEHQLPNTNFMLLIHCKDAVWPVNVWECMPCIKDTVRHSSHTSSCAWLSPCKSTSPFFCLTQAEILLLCQSFLFPLGWYKPIWMESSKNANSSISVPSISKQACISIIFSPSQVSLGCWENWEYIVQWARVSLNKAWYPAYPVAEKGHLSVWGTLSPTRPYPAWLPSFLLECWLSSYNPAFCFTTFHFPIRDSTNHLPDQNGR